MRENNGEYASLFVSVLEREEECSFGSVNANALACVCVRVVDCANSKRSVFMCLGFLI